MNLNFKELRMENCCTFHKAAHLEKTCPQWIHNITVMVTKVLEDQTTREDDEVSEDVEYEASPSNENEGSPILEFKDIRGGEVQSIQEASVVEFPPPEISKMYNLRRKGHVAKPTFEETKKAFLRRILPPNNQTQPLTSTPTPS